MFGVTLQYNIGYVKVNIKLGSRYSGLDIKTTTDHIGTWMILSSAVLWLNITTTTRITTTTKTASITIFIRHHLVFNWTLIQVLNWTGFNCVIYITQSQNLA